MTQMTLSRRVAISLLLATSVATGACATKTGTGAAIGGAGGLAVGALTGNPLAGAAVGAAGGAITGAILDSNDKKKGCYINNHNQKVCPR
jgi:uncharacterized membrane protein